MQEASIDLYNVLRISLGIPEGRKSITPGVALPAHCNLDLAGAISTAKGCYLGQELTVITRSRGVVRRRLMPVQLYNVNST